MLDMRQSLIECFSEGIAHYEGFYVTQVEAKQRKIFWPTIAQRNNNPGNLRAWGSYPREAKHVKFPGPGGHIDPQGCVVGWRALKKQIERNVFDRGLTFTEFFAGKPKVYDGYAPSSDSNRPIEYAEYVLEYLKRHWEPLKMLSDEGMQKVTLDTVIKNLAEVQ